MMTETVKCGCGQDAMPNFEMVKKFVEDDSKGNNCENESTKIREDHSREEKRNPELRKRNVRGPLHRRWSRRMNLDETYRAPSLFTWRC